MLVIFDLDDTLIETSKCLTRNYLRLAFDAMKKKGLKVGEEAFSELISINEMAISSRAALKEFWLSHSDQIEILNSGLEALKTPLPEKWAIDPVPGALELLEELAGDYLLAIATQGDPHLQRQKMKKAGIQPEQFSKLTVGSGQSKKEDYIEILAELNVSPQEAIICGDRVPADLSPAKELGLFTVHLSNGRGKIHKEPKEHVDIYIQSLKELQKVIKKIKV